VALDVATAATKGTPTSNADPTMSSFTVIVISPLAITTRRPAAYSFAQERMKLAAPMILWTAASQSTLPLSLFLTILLPITFLGDPFRKRDHSFTASR
jgi:hypothetical protein